MAQVTGLSNGPATASRREAEFHSTNAGDASLALSSGNRLTKPSTNASASAIVSKVKANVGVLEQTKLNAVNASSLINVVAGGMSDQTTLLIEMKRLTARSNDGSLDDNARNLNNQEFQQLLQQIDDVATRVRWGELTLLNGSAGAVTAAGAVAAAQNGVVVDTVGPYFAAAPVPNADITGFVNGAAEDVSVTTVGPNTYDVSIKIGGQWFESRGIVTGTAGARPFRSIVDSASGFNLDMVATAIPDEVSFVNALRESLGLIVGAVPATFVSVSTALNNGATGITASSNTDPGSYVVRYDGENVVGNTALNGTFTLSNGKQSWTETITASGAQNVTFNNGITVALDGTFDSTAATTQIAMDIANNNAVNLVFQVGDLSTDTLTVNVPGTTTASLGLTGIAVDTVANAATASTSIDRALDVINNAYSRIGAQQRRLESTQANLDTIVDNLEIARSAIEDADIAEFVEKFAMSNTMAQIGQTTFAQNLQLPAQLVQLVRAMP